MTTQIHKIARARTTVVDMPEDAVARIVHKDAGRFVGKPVVTYEDNALVVAYADGTQVSLTL